ncbi:hypothetical protein JCM3774_001300 [Rhodotorula dairenensis]
MTSNNSSNDSTTSPVLSSSPLGTLDNVQASMSSTQRNDSYPEHDLEANGESESVMESGNHEEDPLLAYRRGLYMYTHSHYDRIKSDLELKQSSPTRITPRVK